MANINTIKITQLQNIGANLNGNTLFPVVATVGPNITDKANLNIIGNFILSEAGNSLPQAFLSTFSQSVVNAAQPNITSVGTLTSLNLNSITTFNIPGGNNGDFLQTNGNGNLNWSAAPGAGNGAPGGANSQLQFNNSGLFDGDAALTWDAANAQLNTVGLAASDATIYGNTTTVNATVTTKLTAANSNLANVVSNTISATGNITANFFIGNGSQLTGITAVANGAGPNNSIQYNSNGAFAGDSNLTYNASTDTLTTININASNVTSNVVTANFFNGDGSNISNIGNVNYANSANTANTANLANLVVVTAVNNNFSYHVVLTTGPNDYSLHNDIDDNFQYNPADGILTVTRVDTQFLSAGNVISNLNPFIDNTYSLGSNSLRYKDLYLSNSTIYLGNATISGNGNSIVVDSITVTNGNVGTVGNIASINLDGSSSNVLYGNGVFAPGGGIQSEIANGDSNVRIATAGAPVTIYNDGETWTFDGTNQSFKFPNNSNIDYAGNNLNLGAPVNGAIQFYTDNGNYYFALDSYGYLTLPSAAGLTNSAAISSGIDLTLLSAGTDYVFGANGTLTFPDGSRFYNSALTGSGTLSLLDGTSNTAFQAYETNAVIVTNGLGGAGNFYLWKFDGDGDLTTPAYSTIKPVANSDLNIFVGDPNNDVYYLTLGIDDGDGTVKSTMQFQYDKATIRTDGENNKWIFGNDGNLTLPSNTSSINYANGQPYGGGGGNTGNVTFDNVTIQGVGDVYGGGGLYLSSDPNLTANLQYFRIRGGDDPTHLHFDTGNNSAYDQYFGDDNKYIKLEKGLAGNIKIGTYQDGGVGPLVWIFDSNGNLVLAGGNSVIQSIANSSLDPLNPNVSTMVFTPDANYNGQALVLDPTAPGHIHLRAPGGNIDQPVANIFLGGENSSFEVGYYTGSAPNVFIHSNNYTWTYGTDGNLTLPGNLVIAGNTNVYGTDGSLLQTPDNLPILTLSSGANGSVSSAWLEDIGNVGSSNIAAVYANPIPGSGIVRIVTGQNGGSLYLWDFGTDGSLTLPGDLTGSGASPAPSINGFSSIGAVDSISVGNISLYSNGHLSANTATFTGNISATNLVTWTTAPVANTSNGTAGQAAYDAGGNLYVCVATDIWAKFTGTTSW